MSERGSVSPLLLVECQLLSPRDTDNNQSHCRSGLRTNNCWFLPAFLSDLCPKTGSRVVSSGLLAISMLHLILHPFFLDALCERREGFSRSILGSVFFLDSHPLLSLTGWWGTRMCTCSHSVSIWFLFWHSRVLYLCRHPLCAVPANCRHHHRFSVERLGNHAWFLATSHSY